MGMKPTAVVYGNEACSQLLINDQPHCDTFNLDEMYNLSAIETHQVSIVNTYKVYNNAR